MSAPRTSPAAPSRSLVRLALLAAAIPLLGAACSSDDDAEGTAPSAAPEDSAPERTGDGPDDQPDANEPARSGDATGRGQATITVGAETWTFDGVRCAFGEEQIGVEGAVMNLSAMEGSISLYVNVEPDRTYVELADLAAMDDGGLSYTTMGVGAPDPDIEIDGRAVSAEVELYAYDETGSQTGPVPGTLDATCP